MEQIIAVTKKEAVDRKPTIIVTTFNELIKAISGELRPGEEHLLSIVVMDLFATGRLEFIDNMERLQNIMQQMSKDDVHEAHVAVNSKVPVDTSTGENYYMPFAANWSPPVAGL